MVTYLGCQGCRVWVDTCKIRLSKRNTENYAREKKPFQNKHKQVNTTILGHKCRITVKVCLVHSKFQKTDNTQKSLQPQIAETATTPATIAKLATEPTALLVPATITVPATEPIMLTACATLTEYATLSLPSLSS